MITTITTLEELKNFYTDRKDSREFDKNLLQNLVLDRAASLNFSEEDTALLEIHVGA